MRNINPSAPSCNFLKELYKELNRSLEFHKGKNTEYDKGAFNTLESLSQEIDFLVDGYEYSTEAQ